MSGHVFREVASQLQGHFAAGQLYRHQVTDILTILACALGDEGWTAQAMGDSIEEFQDWPIIVKALKVAQGI